MYGIDTSTRRYQEAHDKIADLLHTMSDVDIVQIAGEIDYLDSLFDGSFSVYQIADLCDCLGSDDVANIIFESGANSFLDTVRHTPYGWEIVSTYDLLYEATEFYFDEIIEWLIDNGASSIDWPLVDIDLKINAASDRFWDQEALSRCA